MAGKIGPGSPQLACAIRERRLALDMDTAQAAEAAGMNARAWAAIEGGGPLLEEEAACICKALLWDTLPGKGVFYALSPMDYVDHRAWSNHLAADYGPYAAMAFIVGSDILLGEIDHALHALTAQAGGTHLGQLGASWLLENLPKQFRMRYEYEFLFVLKDTVMELLRMINGGKPLTPISVLEVISLYLIGKASMDALERFMGEGGMYGAAHLQLQGWHSRLVSTRAVQALCLDGETQELDSLFHFDHWLECPQATDISDRRSYHLRIGKAKPRRGDGGFRRENSIIQPIFGDKCVAPKKEGRHPRPIGRKTPHRLKKGISRV